MVYVSKETKARCVEEAKKVIPADWKVTFAVRNNSTLVATINQAPKAVLADCLTPDRPNVNHYHLNHNWEGKTLEVLQALNQALHTGNHDNSDIQTDYFDVGWYVNIQFGKWDKPCQFV